MFANGESDEVRSTADAELRGDVRFVRFDGLHADAQARRNFTVGKARPDAGK